MKEKIPDIGQSAPDFQLQDSMRNLFQLSRTLSQTKNLLLIFYRGHW
jgi:peroxiredoxin